ncbi:glycerol-3-phosphate dehydrogenase/oxidase [Verminephrobacter aporrectodeae subsp. tuberculatae]|uniref:Glycerol-3-phosphate dehydrogenase/oxidase n=1 Tax=Verminephrobacter aporrectodeae subsp. tuberculatae TaxID=1110392 RepID=A0ABT3KNS2_9BURK|nr:glycerol-3-phosphate dehydrogenase/oxidase [Verminephrobacter aporrectodeae]MCW5319949.1 glycerol-3-phosphate dehydrogenase/oxidase [Verminephrobacter aporrectodeae subsp. tuberculatae]
MNDPQQTFVRTPALAGRHFSVVIVGAGINGVGVFRDLSLQGVDCLVVDKGDFAAGASSAPSRMIHGGLRYLESGAFSLVAEATRERNRLLRNAPHLVRPLRTMVPLSSRFGGLLGSALRFAGRSASPGARGLFVVALGLRLYELLGRRQCVLPGHRISRVPPVDAGLFRPSVRWIATYFDAWISHPEWLILELMADACRDQPRSVAANYCQLTRCDGKAVTLRDEISGEQAQVTADVLVNASGAWLDHAARALAGAGSRVMGTKGSHLVLDHPALHDALDGRMTYFEASDGRVCIVYPFLGRVLLGSTDIPVDDPDQVATAPHEIDYLLGVLRELFPRLRFGRDDVVYTFVGVRPLARSQVERPGQIPREHAVAIDPPNAARAVPLVSLVGGKWTSFRSLAEQASDEVLRQLGRLRVQSTAQLPIGGAAAWPAGVPAMERFLAHVGERSGLNPRRVGDLVRRYGSQALALAEHFAHAGDAPLRHAPAYSVAEIRYLCVHTGVARLSDLVIRRTLLAIRGQLSDPLLAELADVAGAALHWDSARRREELQACAAILRERHHARLAAVPDFDASLPAEPTMDPAAP